MVTAKVSVVSNVKLAKPSATVTEKMDWDLSASATAFLFARDSLILSRRFASNVYVDSHLRARNPIHSCAQSLSCLEATLLSAILALMQFWKVSISYYPFIFLRGLAIEIFFTVLLLFLRISSILIDSTDIDLFSGGNMYMKSCVWRKILLANFSLKLLSWVSSILTRMPNIVALFVNIPTLWLSALTCSSLLFSTIRSAILATVVISVLAESLLNGKQRTCHKKMHSGINFPWWISAKWNGLHKLYGKRLG